MGVAITSLLEGHSITIKELNGKVLAVDAFNMLYQFITTIRMRDGTPLRDADGAVTSHLLGLFSRATTLMAEGLKLVFVFDGKAPELKREEQARRHAVKVAALHNMKEAEAAEDIEAMRKYAGRTATLTPEMIAEAKELLFALGIPVVQAPSEGEAQAAHICKRGDAYAVVSQDADSFLFGAPRVIKNLNLSGRRKRSGTLAYEKIGPEILTLKENLDHLGLTQEQLIVLSILVGTDYNRAGIKGIGPKKALKLLEEYNTEYESIFKLVKWDESYPKLSWRRLLETFQGLPVTDDYKIKWRSPDEDLLRELLIKKHGFSEERLINALKKMKESVVNQRGLGEFF